MNQNHLRIFLAIVILLLTGLLFFLDIFTINAPCGFDLNQSDELEAVTGKEWPCQCFGFKSEVVADNSSKQYCTGINLSNNKLIGSLNEGSQYPVEIE